MEDFDPEDIKDAIVEADYRYYLVPSRRRGATYRVLYCRLPGWASDRKRCVKVDILVPPTDLNLPAISADETYTINHIPCMLIFDLLVMKTQGWWDHCTSNRKDFRAKINNDVSDIDALLECARQQNVSYVDEEYENGHSIEFMSRALALAKRFVRNYGEPRRWRALRFPV